MRIGLAFAVTVNVGLMIPVVLMMNHEVEIAARQRVVDQAIPLLRGRRTIDP